MARWRRLGPVVALACAHGCILFSDFDGLDDRRGEQGATTGAPGGAAGDGGLGVAGEAGAGDGGMSAGGGGASGGAGGAGECKAAIERCASVDECCAPLQCEMTTAGQVCCGLVGDPCVTTGGEDCCGSLECREQDGTLCNGPPCHCND
jgi:hypothetical protein